MNLSPSNITTLLISALDLIGVTQVAEWGQSEYLPIFAQQNLGLSHRQESSDNSVLPRPPISSQTGSSAIKAKKPQKHRGRDLAGPQVFSPAVHPLCLT